MVGGVVAAFVIAVEEGPGEKSVLRGDEHADPDPVVVLTEVGVAEVIGKEAGIEPHLHGVLRERGARAQGEEACKGGSKHEFVVLHLSSARLATGIDTVYKYI
jgi:hypothetical protein